MATNNSLNNQSTNGFTVSGALSSQAGNIDLSTDSNAQTISIGTGNAAKTVTLGSINTTSTTTITAGSGKITLSGGLIVNKTLTSTTPYVVTTSDYFIGVDCSGGAKTVQLPNAPTAGSVFVVKDSTGSAVTHNITLTTVGGAVNIDGATSVTMNTIYESLSVIFDGTAYEIF